MVIGTNDYYEEWDDDFEESQVQEETNEQSVQETTQEVVQEPTQQEEPDFITELLKSRGITDPTQISFENEDGTEEKFDWNSLSLQDKLNIINTSAEQPERDLDESEIALINAIRESQLSPQDYINYIQKQGVDNYIQNNQTQNYKIDDYTNDEIFVMDLLSKIPDITEEEAIQLLEQAKANETIFNKQIDALRKQLKQQEDEMAQQTQAEQEQTQQQQFEEFANRIENAVINFKEYEGWELNLDDDEMYQVYNLLTGRDTAGNSWFGQVLNDPDAVVQMAWFYLFGKNMIENISEYYKNEITNVRKNSYEKGKKDAQNKSTVAYKPKQAVNNQEGYIDDLDDEF